jgi:hypothetical protein
MMIIWKTIGLKGQFNIAQGNALGFGSENIIVRAKTPSRSNSSFGRNGTVLIYDIRYAQFRPSDGFLFGKPCPADGFIGTFPTRGVAPG